VPKIGQTIYYWADVGSRGSNLYQASCFGWSITRLLLLVYSN
jgi:hypothetical protein